MATVVFVEQLLEKPCTAFIDLNDVVGLLEHYALAHHGELQEAIDTRHEVPEHIIGLLLVLIKLFNVEYHVFTVYFETFETSWENAYYLGVQWETVSDVLTHVLHVNMCLV